MIISSVIAGHNTVSYKDIDTRYVDGILDVMRDEFKVNSDIPRKLQYDRPKDYTPVQRKQLGDKVQEFRLMSKDELKHLEQVAAVFRRKMIPVSN